MSKVMPRSLPWAIFVRLRKRTERMFF